MLEPYWQRLDVPEGATVFAPLRGKSLDMPWLVRAGYRVLGSELSPIAVRAFLHEQGLAAKVGIPVNSATHSGVKPATCSWRIDGHPPAGSA